MAPVWCTQVSESTEGNRVGGLSRVGHATSSESAFGLKRCLFPPQVTGRTRNARAVSCGTAAGGRACWDRGNHQRIEENREEFCKGPTVSCSEVHRRGGGPSLPPHHPPQETRSPRARGLGPRKAELSEQRFPESALHEPGGQRSRSKRTETERTWRVRGQGKTEIPKFCIRQE